MKDTTYFNVVNIPPEVAVPSTVRKVTVTSLSKVPSIRMAHTSTTSPSSTVNSVCSRPIVTPTRIKLDQ